MRKGGVAGAVEEGGMVEGEVAGAVEKSEVAGSVEKGEVAGAVEEGEKGAAEWGYATAAAPGFAVGPGYVTAAASGFWTAGAPDFWAAPPPPPEFCPMAGTAPPPNFWDAAAPGPEAASALVMTERVAEYLPEATRTVKSPTKKKKVVTRRLTEEVIHNIMATPFSPRVYVPDHILMTDEMRAIYASRIAFYEEATARDRDIIQQYHEKGYADLKVEVDDYE